jgi:acetylornithine deacetylase/succinyl-diaminopimelate desuccinylase-like protein
LDANDAIAGACELAISARIRGDALSVIAAIDLDYEARAARIEVIDEAEQRDLPPKGDPELARAQRDALRDTRRGAPELSL